ncbi:MAG: alpha/beta hydrolase [Sphingobacteriales bacterium]|nr:MAG: alpha/beta hydrolase [Sphingobacteriales bacterium]
MRRLFRRILWFLLIVFVLVNGIAAMHAWHFTHFDATTTAKTPEKGLSIIQKLGILFTGVRNPKPLNSVTPDTIYQTITLKSDVRLEGWWLPVPAPKGTVLLLHGYGGSKAGLLNYATQFRRFGYNTLLLDFRGAGGSAGDQCTIGYKEAADVTAAVRFLNERGEKNIYLFGTSMGAAAALRALATDSLPVKGAIIECPFGSMLQTVKNRFHTQGVPTFPLAHLLLFWGGVENGFNAFAHNPEAYASSVRCPVLLLWGAKDEKVTQAETDRIYAHLQGPKKLVVFPEAGHENYLRKYAPEWTAAVDDFLP